MKPKLYTLCLVALFCALAAIGGQIKPFPAPFTSVALDALPAFLAALLIGPKEGALVGAAGHLLSAYFAGFPLSLPMHLVIAVEMAAVCWIAGWLAHGVRWPLWAAALVGFFLNAFISPLLVAVWPGYGWGACIAFLLPLTIGSAVNAGGAAALAAALKKPYAAVGRQFQ